MSVYRKKALLNLSYSFQWRVQCTISGRYTQKWWSTWFVLQWFLWWKHLHNNQPMRQAMVWHSSCYLENKLVFLKMSLPELLFSSIESSKKKKKLVLQWSSHACLQLTPASSQWRQLCVPTGGWEQLMSINSVPVHRTLSRNIGPVPWP